MKGIEAMVWCVVPPRAGPFSHLPAIGPSTDPGQIEAFRARVLFANGRRPAFEAEGAYVDADPLDRHAFLIALRHDGELVGCIRTNPTSTHPPSSMAALLGPERLAKVFGELGVSRGECWDGGRWAVSPERQRSAIGGALVCAAMAVARQLGARRLVGVAGTGQRQADRLESLGARPLTSIAPVHSASLDDTVRAVSFDLDDLHATAVTAVVTVAGILRRAWPHASVVPPGDPNPWAEHAQGTLT